MTLRASTTTSALPPDGMATLQTLDDEDEREMQTDLEDESKSPEFDADAVEAFQTGNIMG